MRTRHAERGAILVYVAITILALMAFSAFVIDYGVFWLARHQAQNAADAGAMAGTIARLFDEPDTPGTITSASASAAATANPILGEAPVVVTDARVGVCPAWALPPRDVCVRVEVYRDAANGNPWPTYFGPLLGVTSQGVRAAATAQRRPANATDCLRPLMLPDLGGSYSAPPDTSDTPGYTLSSLGSEVLLDPTVTDKSTPGFFVEVELGQGGGWGDIRGAIAEPCPSRRGSRTIYETVDTFATHQPGGAAITGLQDVIDLDRSAKWDSAVKGVRESCAPACAPFSPRIITLALFNPARSAGDTVYIRDFFSVFVDRISAGVAHVYVTPSVGKMKAGGMPLANAGFLNVVAMVR